MIRLEFVGAAGTVTGSKHLVHTDRGTILLDCGLFQGRRRESIAENRELGFRARDVAVAVLSHAHIDHSGALPVLVKNGFDGLIYGTPATRDLCAVMLEDGAMIQASDAAYVNKLIDRGELASERVKPLYTSADVVRVLERMVAVPYSRTVPIGEGARVTFIDAGHVLGSAVVVLDIDDESGPTRIVYSGDLGRRNRPILRDPEVAHGAQVLVLESTYGDRNHAPAENESEEAATFIRNVIGRGGKIVIPAFALERAQEVVFSLKQLRERGAIPPVPVYVDSPLTVKITDVFRLHPECFDEEARGRVESQDSPFDFEDLRYVSTKEDSQAIDASDEPCIILAASGMCEAGRVVHHLKATIENPRNAVAIVGYQAPHTLGRRIAERNPRVRVFGVERDLRAEVKVFDSFSAHAGQDELLAYAEAVRKHGSLEKVVLVHGDPPALAALKAELDDRDFPDVVIPARGDVLDVGGEGGRAARAS